MKTCCRFNDLDRKNISPLQLEGLLDPETRDPFFIHRYAGVTILKPEGACKARYADQWDYYYRGVWFSAMLLESGGRIYNSKWASVVWATSLNEVKAGIDKRLAAEGRENLS